jgi:hypothetical protein
MTTNPERPPQIPSSELPAIVAGQCRIIGGRYEQGLSLGSDSLLRLAEVAARLAGMKDR